MKVEAIRFGDALPGLVWTALPDGQIVFLNQRWREYTGLSPRETAGWGWQSAIFPADLPRFLAEWRSIVASGQSGEMEARLRRFDTVYRWFLFRLSPLDEGSATVTKWCGINTDIEDHKQTEAIRANARRLNQIINTIPTTVWSARPDGSCDFLNQRWLDYTGLTEEQALGWGWAAAIHPEDFEALAEYWKFCLATGTPVDTEVRMRRYDGAYRWFLLRGAPLRDEAGAITKWYGTNIDIEDRKQAEDELRRSEARKTAILDSALDCIVTIDHEGRITEFNPAAERTFGHRRAAVVGQLLADVVIPPSLRERHRQGLARYLATGETRFLGQRVELTAIRADGSEFPVEIAITRIPSDGPPSFTGYVRDITDRKRADEELRRSEAGLREAQDKLAHVTRVTTMGELAASIAHEVNQPIAGVVINGNACLRRLSRVEEDSVDLTEAREALQRIIRDGSRAGEIIGRIRALFKKTESTRGPLDLNETIREIIVLARNEMEKQRVTLRLELSPDLPRVFGDRVQLQQVMLNLILNAMDAMATLQDRNRDLVIRTQRREVGEVLVTVRDSGIGLSPESIDHVFRAFHTTKPSGLGMGLPISRSIVEGHSGRLWVAVHDGPGASFCFTLPSHSS